MIDANSTVLIGKPLYDDLVRLLDRPLRMANDDRQARLVRCKRNRTRARLLLRKTRLHRNLFQRQALLMYEDRLARALASVINVLDPDAIVLGGGVSNIERLYERVPLLLPGYIFADAVRTKLLRATHGDSSGVRGAAMLGRERGVHG